MGVWIGKASVIGNAKGGTGQDTSGWTGYPYITAGVWAQDAKLTRTADGLFTMTSTLDDATGDETAFVLNVTANKATSGDASGLVINFTSTAIPDNGYPLAVNADGNSLFRVNDDGTMEVGFMLVMGQMTPYALTGDVADGEAGQIAGVPTYYGDGIIATVAVTAQGTGYLVNDVLTIVQAGASGGTVTVATIGGSGEVTSVTLTTGGLGYEIDTGLATTGGTGSDCTIEVATLTTRTVNVHNYLLARDASLSNGAAVTDSALFYFDDVVGTHKALASPGTVAVTLLGTGPTGANAGNPLGWIKINVYGTLRYIPYW